MKDKVEREFDAYVTGVTSFGALRDARRTSSSRGSSRSPRWETTSSCTRRSSTAFAAASSGRIYRLGDPIRVQLKANRRGAAAPRLPACRRRRRIGRGSATPAARRREAVAPEIRGAAAPAMRADAGAPTLLALARRSCLGACRERGRPDPAIRMAISHEPTPAAEARPAASAGGRTRQTVPTRLEVPPEVTEALLRRSGCAGRTPQNGKEGIVEVPIGGSAPLPGLGRSRSGPTSSCPPSR